jgi:diguanylate cyclase (GGDEF)-like protein
MSFRTGVGRDFAQIHGDMADAEYHKAAGEAWLPLLLRRVPRRTVYAVLGAALAVGAPVGLLLVRFTTGQGDSSWIVGEIAAERLTYTYVTVSTMSVFALFGWLLGCQADRLIELSTTDGLTGLLNVRGFHQRLQQELARARRSRQPLSLVAIDVDGLKGINDRHGHEVGDQALQAVAQTISATLRVTDVAARLGGDEFTLLAPNTPEAPAIGLAERLRLRATGPQSQLALLAASVSLGVVTFDPVQGPWPDAAALMRAADEALYDAKRGGRNRVTATRLARTA